MNDQEMIAKLLALSANDALSQEARDMLHAAANRLTALHFALSKYESVEPPA
jgi:two-component sensor histidine kinase